MIKAPAMQGFLNEESKKVCAYPLLNIELVFSFQNDMPCGSIEMKLFFHRQKSIERPSFLIVYWYFITKAFLNSIAYPNSLIP